MDTAIEKMKNRLRGCISQTNDEIDDAESFGDYEAVSSLERERGAYEIALQIIDEEWLKSQS